MSNFNSKDKKIFEDMKQCVKDLGLEIMDEQVLDGHLSGFSKFEYSGYNLGIIFYFNPSLNMAEVFLRYADMPAEKLPALYELLNYINGDLSFNHLFIDPTTRTLVLRSSLFITGYFLDKNVFKKVMTQNLGVGHTFIPLVAKLIYIDQSPKSIMDEFHAGSRPGSFKISDATGKTKKPKMSAKHPFIIHGCKDMPAFPTHTHGLTELGLPEFLIDHLCMGINGNGGFINASYKYFNKPENAVKLDAIKSGKTVKLTPEDLKPDIIPSELVYCFRRVYPDFQMVKEAYDLNDPNQVGATTWFVQIYVEGDDYALKDDYYKGGIKW